MTYNQWWIAGLSFFLALMMIRAGIIAFLPKTRLARFMEFNFTRVDAMLDDHFVEDEKTWFRRWARYWL